MFSLFAIGGIVMILNFIGLMPFDDPINWHYVGLASVVVGFVMTLNYR